MKKKHEEEHENVERWLLTYSDLITLMMAFFVILFAMAQVDAAKFKTLSQSLSMAFGAHGGSGGTNMLTNFQGARVAPPSISVMSEDSQFNDVMKLIREYTNQAGISKSVQASIQERGLVLNLADTVLFESGKADLSPRAQAILDHLAEIIFSTGRMIRVEGHTDNIPINTARYRSNWQLSTDRATNVIMYWISKYPDAGPRLSAGGYGEFRPIATNQTAEGRTKNRRVEIVLLRQETADKEPGAKPAEAPAR
jgi:chemotaxis protein MotB